MHPQLSTIITELRSAQEHLHRFAAALRPDQWKRVDLARWSPAECIEHLNLTSRAFIPLLERAIGDARALGDPAPRRYHRDPMGWFLWKVMPPPVRMRVSTTAAFVPGSDRPPAELLAEFDRLQSTLVGLTGAADGLPIQRTRVPSPFSARASYNAYAALTILAPHQERHIWQAERTVA